MFGILTVDTLRWKTVWFESDNGLFDDILMSGDVYSQGAFGVGEVDVVDE